MKDRSINKNKNVDSILQNKNLLNNYVLYITIKTLFFHNIVTFYVLIIS